MQPLFIIAPKKDGGCAGLISLLQFTQSAVEHFLEENLSQLSNEKSSPWDNRHEINFIRDEGSYRL